MPELSIPQLLLKEELGESHFGRRALTERFASLCSDLTYLETPRQGSDEFLRLGMVTLPGLTVCNLRHSSMGKGFNASSCPMLFLPLGGQERIRREQRKLVWGEGLGSLFVPQDGERLETDSDDLHYLMLVLDPERLKAAARAMLGSEQACAAPCRLDHTQLVPDHMGSISGDAMARHISACINLYWQTPQWLHHLGLQEFIYRQLVMMFFPQWRDVERAHATRLRPHKRRSIDRVCDAMLSDLSGRFTLTDMANLGNMSVRSLQYAFQRRFEMSPGEWLREQRLAHAHQRLVNGQLKTIAHLAQEYGFSTASRFTLAYKQRFGKAPSSTLRNLR